MPKFLRNAFDSEGNIAGVDPRTVEARYSHPFVGQWFPTTQAWKWEGGDALTVITGKGASVQAYVVLRLGNEIHTVAANGLNAALEAVGEDLAEYKVWHPPVEEAAVQSE